MTEHKQPFHHDRYKPVKFLYWAAKKYSGDYIVVMFDYEVFCDGRQVFIDNDALNMIKFARSGFKLNFRPKLL